MKTLLKKEERNINLVAIEKAQSYIKKNIPAKEMKTHGRVGENLIVNIENKTHQYVAGIPAIGIFIPSNVIANGKGYTILHLDERYTDMEEIINSL